MKRWILLLVFLSSCGPQTQMDENSIDLLLEESPRDGWVLVGDMYVPEENIILDSDKLRPHGFVEKDINLWPGGVLPLVFASNVSQRRKELFLRSCAEMGKFANVRCVNKGSNHNDYLVVQHTNERVCGSSYLGRYGGGGQPLKIQCWRTRTIQHELMHALGVSHEHNRPDRDNHIVVLWNNIEPQLKRSYRKVLNSGTSNILSYYDISSIMHYGSSSGAIPGKMAFYKKDSTGSGFIRQTNKMSYGDHYFLYSLYGGKKP